MIKFIWMLCLALVLFLFGILYLTDVNVKNIGTFIGVASFAACLFLVIDAVKNHLPSGGG